MKRTIHLILLAGLIGASMLWAQDSQTDQETIKQLQLRLHALEQRVTALEKKAETKYIALPPSQFEPQQPPHTEKPPGQPFEFNGKTYYMVPLKQGDADKK